MLEHIEQPMELYPGLTSCNALSHVVSALHNDGVKFSATQRPQVKRT